MRMCVFCLYDDLGYVREDVIYLIRELRAIVDYLVIVINGGICDDEEVRHYADYVIHRLNVGFDAGAYKQAILNPDLIEKINVSDELILCNATFYGPLISFTDIFRQMEEKNCDFWGINLSTGGLEDFLQSYFLVFRKKIIASHMLLDFFMEYIDENEEDINKVLIYFERGLYRYLIKRECVAGNLCIQRNHILRNSCESVMMDNVPIVKKKAFMPEYMDRRRALFLLKYIDKKTIYPIDLIVNDIKRKKLWDISLEDIERIDLSRMRVIPKCENNCKKIDAIIPMIEKRQDICMLGRGRIARELLLVMERDGFEWRKHISEVAILDGGSTEEFFGMKVNRITNPQKMLQGRSVLVAMGEKNSIDVMDKIGNADAITIWN